MCYPGSPGDMDKDGDSNAGTLPSPELTAPGVGISRFHLIKRPALNANINSLYLKESRKGNKETTLKPPPGHKENFNFLLRDRKSFH